MSSQTLLEQKLGFELTYVDHSDMQQASEEYFSLCVKWMSFAIRHSVSQTLGMLQVQQSNVASPNA